MFYDLFASTRIVVRSFFVCLSLDRSCASVLVSSSTCWAQIRCSGEAVVQQGFLARKSGVGSGDLSDFISGFVQVKGIDRSGGSWIRSSKEEWDSIDSRHDRCDHDKKLIVEQKLELL